MQFGTHAHDETYPPLISPESPSYERAWHELAHPSSAGDPAVIALLSRLSEAEQNAAQVCSTLPAALGDDPLVAVLQDRAAVHTARRQALGKLIEQIGGSAPTDAECRDILVRACDEAGHAESTADAKRVLKVLRAELRGEYDAGLQSKQLDPAQRGALANLAPPALPAHE